MLFVPINYVNVVGAYCYILEPFNSHVSYRGTRTPREPLECQYTHGYETRSAAPTLVGSPSSSTEMRP